MELLRQQTIPFSNKKNIFSKKVLNLIFKNLSSKEKLCKDFIGLFWIN